VDHEQEQTFHIGEAAYLLGVGATWLRVAERLGTTPRARRDAQGWRVYTAADVERLRRLGVGERKKRLAAGR
jgi:DNA-binding transcriptional MerR regulator